MTYIDKKPVICQEEIYITQENIKNLDGKVVLTKRRGEIILNINGYFVLQYMTTYQIKSKKLFIKKNEDQFELKHGFTKEYYTEFECELLWIKYIEDRTEIKFSILHLDFT